MTEFLANPWEVGGPSAPGWARVAGADVLVPPDEQRLLTFAELWSYRLPTRSTVRVSLFVHRAADVAEVRAWVDSNLAQARRTLEPHNLGLEVRDLRDKPLDGPSDVGSDEDANELRSRAAAAFDDQKDDPQRSQRLPVIVTQSTRSLANGQTFRNSGWPAYCLLYGDKVPIAGDDFITLLHEAGHAAGLEHDKRSAQSEIDHIMYTRENGMDAKGGPMQRTNMYAGQVTSFSRAYFTR